jgi:hypothetical protein
MANFRWLKWGSPALALIVALPALAQDYPFDIVKQRPAAIKSWRSVVPTEYRKRAWIYSLDGTSGPVETVTVHDKVFLFGSVCIPHDCGGNFIAFLIARDGGEAFGELASETLGVKQRYFGAPDAEARGLLDKKISE